MRLFVLASAFKTTMAIVALLAAPGAQAASSAPPQPAARHEEKIAPYEPRFGRARPVIAVIGENSGTELTDYVIPYSMLTQSGKAEVLALSIAPGTVTMRLTSLQMVPHADAAQFDARFPDGADYVVVPAVVKRDDPRLLAWITAQSGKGATIVSICDGALVLANAGLLKGRRATAHWFTAGTRLKDFPDTEWVKNTRYVADGKVVSSAGISAAVPTSLALIEAIAGRESAMALAAQYGVSDWSTRHDSDIFVPRLGVNLSGYAATNVVNRWFFRNERVGVPVSPGVDDIALALTMDAYSRTGRSRAYAVAASNAPILTRSGLAFLPELVQGSGNAPDRLLSAVAHAPAANIFDHVLADIAKSYGSATAAGVAYDFEYTISR